MAFARKLGGLLRLRERLMPDEFAKGEPLESVLERYLMVVESTAESDTLTSILLLDGTTLRDGAAPKLPKSYRDQIDGLQIGACAGSCGTAAFRGHPVYVSDIANDPLWENYRHIAEEHGLRACWSTPIRNSDDRLIGTFAVYHQRPRSPTKAEVESIGNITEHVARAIMFYRGADFESEYGETHEPPRPRPNLRLVSDSDVPSAHNDDQPRG